jgi:hypothetical protein
MDRWSPASIDEFDGSALANELGKCRSEGARHEPLRLDAGTASAPSAMKPVPALLLKRNPGAAPGLSNVWEA